MIGAAMIHVVLVHLVDRRLPAKSQGPAKIALTIPSTPAPVSLKLEIRRTAVQLI